MLIGSHVSHYQVLSRVRVLDGGPLEIVADRRFQTDPDNYFPQVTIGDSKGNIISPQQRGSC